jgi:hypothetical protein
MYMSMQLSTYRWFLNILIVPKVITDKIGATFWIIENLNHIFVIGKV